VSPRVRVSLAVGAIALAAAGVTVGATLLAADERGGQPAAAPSQLRPGAPPLVFDLGVRLDPEARDLRRGAALYDSGSRARAARVFARYRSLEARVGSALATWPRGRDRVAALARANPRSALVQLHLGLVRYWEGRTESAEAAWRRAKTLAPDTAYAVRAGDLLHPNLPIPGLPTFVPGFQPPAELVGLSAPRQLELLARRARTGGARDKLLYGVGLQRIDRPLSARRQFDAALRQAPDDPEAQVAAAVGRFDKDRPADAFGRLGPLARTHPRSPTVRFHLGLLLLWLGRVEEGRRQLRLAERAGPATPLGREARRFLERLGSVGTNGPQR
jgi:tetratricopeptide (TPR) repeat protein